MEEMRVFAIDGIIADAIEDEYFLSPKLLSGVSLRIDPYWLRWEEAVIIPSYFNFLSPYLNLSKRDLRVFHGFRHDFDLKPQKWGSYCKRKGYPYEAHPVTVIAILRNPLNMKAVPDLPRAIGPHPIIYEHRPEATGYLLKPGDFLGCATEGTLGGFLWDTSDFSYKAMSCAHVLGTTGRAYSPAPTIFGAKTEIGSVTFSEMPIANHGKCNRKIQPFAPVIDLALATVDAGNATLLPVPGAGRITRDTSIGDMDQDDAVDFVGHKSGRVSAKTAELNIWKELIINGVSTCFSDLFVIDHVNYPYFGTALARPGDSGSWITATRGTTVSWDGMLIGGDGIRAYCSFAENIMNTLTNEPLILP